jgi:hypothetical protein
MITKQKKPIAMFLVLAFVALLQVSVLPLRADRAPDRVVASTPDQGPGYIEEEGGPSHPAKKSIVPVLLIGVGVAALAAVLVLVVFKTKYDIIGDWEFSFNSASPAHTWSWALTFRGEKKSGTFSDEYGDTGTFTVDGTNVVIAYDEWDINLTGAFDGKDRMTGSATFSGLTIGGKDITSASWTANRASGGAAKPALPMAAGRKAGKSRI